MTCYVCLDDKNGMRFNHRRQSRDALLLADMQQAVPKLLHADAVSGPLLTEAGIPWELAPEDLRLLPEDAHFFLEARPAGEALVFDRIVIYRWNRHYPADTFWNLDLTAAGYRLTEATDFSGSSHETITKEVYTRCES